MTRPEPPLVAGERKSLEAWLNYHRDTLLIKCSGLTAEQLKQRAVPPSGLCLLGLVRHMTEVERWWFRIHAGDQDMAFRYFAEDNLNGDFDDLDTLGAPAVLAAFGKKSSWRGRPWVPRTWTTWSQATAIIPSGCATSAGYTST